MTDEATIYETCPFCGVEKIPSRIGSHLYEEHWEEIGELAEQREK